MESINDFSVKLDGKLNCIFMKAQVKQTVIKDSNNINIQVTLENKGKIEDTQLLAREKTSLVVKLGDTILYNESINIDFSQNDILKIATCNQEYNNSISAVFPLEISLIVSESESDYIKNTSIHGLVQVIGNILDKLFIDLEGTKTSSSVVCIYTTTVKPDFCEYKVNTGDWIKIDKIQFVVPLEPKMYIQVRGKYKGVYSYSNVIKVDE